MNNLKFLSEERFPSENMTKKERDFILTFLYSTKELEDNPDMIIEQCHLKKIDNDLYKANGIISSTFSDNRCFDAYIDIESNKISIKSDIVKICSVDVNKEFTEYTVFTKQSEEIYHRQTKYSFSKDSRQ